MNNQPSGASNGYRHSVSSENMANGFGKYEETKKGAGKESKNGK